MQDEPQMVSLSPTQMRLFGTRVSALDEELQREAIRLTALLRRFDTSCVEPGFRLPPLTPLADHLHRIAREATELTDWMKIVASRIQEADAVATATFSPRSSSVSDPSEPISATAARNVLLQTRPDGDPSVLATVRYEHAQQLEVSMFSGRTILTVADHIREYGCLLTSYAMLLRDAGASVTLADLYKANYALQTGRTFDADAQQGAVTIFDLNSTPALIARVANGAFQSAGGALGADPARDLRAALDQVGAVIVHTERAGSDHWIVVDGANPDGSFNVRDPMRGQQWNVFMGSHSDAHYRLAPKAAFLYLQSNT